MNKKGFTLVEIIVSVGLLALIGVAVGISLNKTFKNQEKMNYQEYVDKVKSAALLYANNSAQITNELNSNASFKILKVEELMDTYHVSNALAEIWAIISRSNKYIDETAPWVLAKAEGIEHEKLKSVMYHLAENLRKVAVMISIVMPDTGKKILEQLGIKNASMLWDEINNETITEGTKVIEKGEPLFMRLDKEEEIEFIKEQMKK